MNKSQTFEQFLTSSSVPLSVTEFIINFLIAAVLSMALGLAYERYGTALSNRKAFARNFALIATTTMLIITIVKSSLALSLGLVGALSIVRFRTAIKEPEELAYMFFCIAIGLGLGADQRPIVVTAFVCVIVFIILRNTFSSKTARGTANLYLTVSSETSTELGLEEIVDCLREHCVSLELKRFDENSDIKEAAFHIEVKDLAQLTAAKDALQARDKNLQLSVLDNLGAFM